MSSKLIYFLVFIFSTIGAYIPALWGDSFLSLWSVVLGGIGGIFGLWLAYKLMSRYGL